MHEVFAPRAQSAGAEVLAVVVETSNGNSGAVICELIWIINLKPPQCDARCMLIQFKNLLSKQA